MTNLFSVSLLTVVLWTIAARGQEAQSPADRVQWLKADLDAKPGETIDRLNNKELGELMKLQRYADVEALAMEGTLALPADTWRLEVLQSFRVKALLAEHKNDEALHAAKGL